MAHDKFEAFCMDTGEVVGRVTINDHPRAMSLDMQCLTCGHVVSRRYLERSGVKDPSEYPQGRPMGTLLAWVQHCPGSAQKHKDAMADGFDYNCRKTLRCWHFEHNFCLVCFSEERDPWSHEGQGHEAEPDAQC